MTSRPMVLVFLLLILIITSQFEWKQQLVNDLEPSPSISQKQQHILKREDVVKEKRGISPFGGALRPRLSVSHQIILSQEKNIQKLNELVQSLQDQLLQCRGSSNTSNSTAASLVTNSNGLDDQQILED